MLFGLNSERADPGCTLYVDKMGFFYNIDTCMLYFLCS